jgi:hypothetical protein
MREASKLGPPQNRMHANAFDTSTRPQTYDTMDSPVVTQLFRQLFRHRTCPSLRSNSTLPFRIDHGRKVQRRSISDKKSTADESNWQQRTDIFPLDMTEEYNRYPMVTSDQLKGRKERPRRVKMLTRDFIEGMHQGRSIWPC